MLIGVCVCRVGGRHTTCREWCVARATGLVSPVVCTYVPAAAAAATTHLALPLHQDAGLYEVLGPGPLNKLLDHNLSEGAEGRRAEGVW